MRLAQLVRNSVNKKTVQSFKGVTANNGMETKFGIMKTARLLDVYSQC